MDCNYNLRREMAKRVCWTNRRRAILSICLLISCTAVYLTGVIEYLTAKPYSEFSWPLELNIDQVISDYDKGKLSVKPINKNDFDFTLLPTKDSCKEFKSLTVLIKSKVDDFVSRDILRQTWVNTLNERGHRHAFLLGLCGEETPSTTCQSLVDKEHNKYGDLIQGEFVDAYTNNTHKMTMALRYLTEHCIRFNSTLYILLIDNDFALNVYYLEKHLASEMITKSNLYAGYVWPNSRPFRLPLHKHYMSLTAYPFSHYPPFVAAGVVLLSTDIVKKMYVMSMYTQYYPFDDVFYGFVAKKLGVTPTNIGELVPIYFNVPSVYDAAHAHLIASHRFGKIQEVQLIHRKFGQG